VSYNISFLYTIYFQKLVKFANKLANVRQVDNTKTYECVYVQIYVFHKELFVRIYVS